MVLIHLILLLVVAQYLAWVFVQAEVQADPTGPVALLFWGGQVASFGLCLLVGMVGFQPAITVSLVEDRLHLQQGEVTQAVPLAAITEARLISARLFHRHYRRYAATQVFINRLGAEVLLLETAEAPLVLGLAAEEAAALRTHLEAAKDRPMEIAAAVVV